LRYFVLTYVKIQERRRGGERGERGWKCGKEERREEREKNSRDGKPLGGSVERGGG